jgi:ABC-type glycerol-3-phosphate transport system permease component
MKNRKDQRIHMGWIGWGFLSVVAIGYLMPLIWLISSAFKPASEIFTIPIRLWSNHFTIQNFIMAQTQWKVGQSFINSVELTVGSVLLQLLICSWCAFALATMKFKGRRIIFYIILATMMLPGFTMIVPSYRVATSLKLINNFMGLILPGSASAFGVFLLRQHFIKIPPDFFEAALMDGANQIKIWWQIAMPLAKPALAALAIFSFIAVWRDLLWPMLILQKEELFTLPIKIFFMKSYFTHDYGSIMATGFVAALVPVVFFLFFQRQFIEGISGGIKS